MKLKYIYIITICFCYFSLKAKENKKSIIEDTPQLKKAFQSLYEKIKAPQNQKTDYLIDFGTANSVTASDLKNLAVNGGTSILDQNTQNEVITKLDYFNSVNGYGGKNNTKLFAFTGRIILGYSNVREFDYAGTSNTKSESTKDEELFKALQLGSQSKNLSSPLYDSTFVQTLDSEWSNFKNLSSPKKTMVCFFVEAILIRAKQIDGQVVSRNDTYTPEREIVKSYFVLVWQNGLDAFDWYKINNEENKAQLTITYNVQGGFTQQSEFPAFVQKMQDFLSSNLVLDTPEKAIKFVQKTYASEKSLLLNMSFDKRKDLLTTIDKASTLRDCTPSSNEVSEKCGENAVLKLFETTPEAQFNDMLTLLKLPSSNDPQKMLLVSLCKKMTDVGYGGNSYGTLMAYINSFALKAYPIDFSSQNWEQIRADRFVRIDEGEDVGDHINIIILDEKTGKIKLQRKLITYIKKENIQTGYPVSVTTETTDKIKLNDVELDPFTLIFVTNQSHVSSIAEGGITNDVSGNYEGNTYSGCYTTAYSLTYIDQKVKNKEIIDAVVVLASVASIVSGPGAAAVAIQEANILKAGYVAFEMATSVGNITEAMIGVDPNSLEGKALAYANMVGLFYGGYKGVFGSAKVVGNLPETIKNVSTNLNSTTIAQKIDAVKSFFTAFDAAESILSAKAIYPKLKGFRDVCLRVLKNAGEDIKLSLSNIDNIHSNYMKLPFLNTSILKVKNGNVTSAKIINASTTNFVYKTAELAEQVSTETILFKPSNNLTSIDNFSPSEVSTLSSKGGENIIKLYNRNSGYAKGSILGDDVYLFEGNTAFQPLPNVANLPKGKIVPLFPKYPAKGFALAFIPNDISLISKAVLLVASPEVARDILEEEKLKDCDICKEERKIYCSQAQLLLTKVGITYKLAIKKLCDNLSLANTVSVFNTLTGTGFSIAEAQAFLNNINEISTETDHISKKIDFVTENELNTWLYFYKNHSTNAKFTRVDFSALRKWNFINTTAQSNIVKFSDNLSSSTLKKFISDLDANNQGTPNDNINLFINYKPEITEGFTGHKLKAENKTEEDYKVYYDLLNEEINDYPLQDRVINIATKWLKYSKEDSKRQDFYQQGRDFETWVGNELTKGKDNPIYIALKQKITDLDERSIYTQVYFCLNSSTPYTKCEDKGQYFIADFVFAKESNEVDPITNMKKIDVIIADTKLSANTSFTQNQNAARGLSAYNVRRINRPILRRTTDGLLDGNKVNRNMNIDFYKIYRGPINDTLGGIIP